MVQRNQFNKGLVMASTTWTSSARKKLRELAGQGLTSSKIGAALGRTKSSVIGQCRRQGIPLLAPSVKSCKKSSKGLLSSPAKEFLHEELHADTSSAVKGFDLTSSQCRAVVGYLREGLYCGKTVDSGSFCENHRKVYCIRAPTRRVLDSSTPVPEVRLKQADVKGL